MEHIILRTPNLVPVRVYVNYPRHAPYINIQRAPNVTSLTVKEAQELMMTLDLFITEIEEAHVG